MMYRALAFSILLSSAACAQQEAASNEASPTETSDVRIIPTGMVPPSPRAAAIAATA